MSKNLICLLAISFALTTISISNAQQRVMIALNVSNDGQEDFDLILADFRDSAQFHVTSRLLEIKKACDLSEPQYKRLSVASKGAIKKFVATENARCLTMLRRYQQQAGFDMDKIEGKEDEDEEKPGDQEDEDDEEEEQERQIRNFSFSLQTLAPSKIENELRWVDSLETVLTEEQVNLLETAQLDREARIKDAAVDRFVAKMDLSLFLTEEQRPKIREAIFNKFGDLLVKEIIFEEQYRRPTMRANQFRSEPEHGDLVKGVLTEEQTRQWNRVVEPHLRYLDTLKNRR